MEGVHDVILLLDSCFLVALAPLIIPLVQRKLLEPFSFILLNHGHVTGARDGFSQGGHVQHDSYIAGQVHGRFNHVELSTLKALINVLHAHLKQGKLLVVVEGGDGGHPHVVIGVGVKRLKKSDR